MRRLGGGIAAALAWCVTSGVARSQPAPPATEPVAPRATEPAPPPPPTIEPAPAAPPPPPAPPAPTAVVANVPIRIHGILHAMVELTEGVQSFDNATAVAPTSALNPALVAEPDRPKLSFQVQQTRLGMTLGETTPFRGVLEIDFTHFDQSSPTVQAFPRIRQALVAWSPAEGHEIFVGQTWDLFGNTDRPLLSHSFNLVGSLFRAGNVGFMRQQVGYAGRFGDVGLAAAVGMQGANAGPTFSQLEDSLAPTGAVRILAHLGEHGVAGASGLATALRLTAPGLPPMYRPALGGELFGDLTFGPVALRAEAYLAQNLANVGALNLGFGRYDEDVADVGAYVSARWTLGDHALTAMVGGAATLSPGDVVPGYVPADPTATPPVLLGVATPPTGPGIHHNVSAHVGYWYSPLAGLSFVAEPYVYVTRFELHPVDEGTFSRDRVAFGGMLGSMFQL